MYMYMADYYFSSRLCLEGREGGRNLQTISFLAGSVWKEGWVGVHVRVEFSCVTYSQSQLFRIFGGGLCENSALSLLVVCLKHKYPPWRQRSNRQTAGN